IANTHSRPSVVVWCFFFQAEDGIRDATVTGVQTCALPILPLMKLRLAAPRYVIDLGRLRGMSYIREENGQIAIGALTTHADVEASTLLRGRCPLLPETAAEIGDLQVRNRGTLGGSLAHADPAADYPAAILALDAEIVAASTGG